MPTNWEPLIASALATPPPVIQAMTFLRSFPYSASCAVQVTGHDGKNYVVKGNLAGRQAINDQVVGRLAQSIGAPTGRTALVHISQALIDLSPQLQDVQGRGPFLAGDWHASEVIENVSDDREAFLFTRIPENRSRFSELALLYGWVFVNMDHQFLYSNADPRIVFSVDHGHFFPFGPTWNAADLQGFTAGAVPDETIASACALGPTDLKHALPLLSGLNLQTELPFAVASPRDLWGISMNERVALADYLERRHGEIIAAVNAL
jgi:hypothetical protein